jgi:hypothetical protein
VDLSEDEVWAVTAYLRTLSFDTAPIAAALAPSATPEAVTATEPPAATEAGTPSAEGTPLGTEQVPATSEATAVVQAGFGNVSGSIENKTGADLPSDLKVTLRGYQHGADPNTGPEEVFSEEAPVNEDGTFIFENAEIPLNRIFVAELTFDGLALQSGFVIVEEGDTAVNLPPIVLYGKTEDTSRLVIDETRIFFEYGESDIKVYNVYSFRNPSEEIVVVKLNEQGEIPFLKSPEGSSGVGYEAMQDSENFLQTDNGFAIPPSENPYGLIASASLPKEKEFEFSQEFTLPAATVTLFMPEGVTVKTDGSNDLGVQTIQDFNFQIYELDGVEAGEKVNLTVSGTPKEEPTASAPQPAASNQNLLIGAGVLGAALILAGAWMYLRDRKRGEDLDGGEDEEEEFESADDVMDAIIVLDDLHRAQKISDEAYQKRRLELKEILKEKM